MVDESTLFAAEELTEESQTDPLEPYRSAWPGGEEGFYLDINGDVQPCYTVPALSGTGSPGYHQVAWRNGVTSARLGSTFFRDRVSAVRRALDRALYQVDDLTNQIDQLAVMQKRLRLERATTNQRAIAYRKELRTLERATRTSNTSASPASASADRPADVAASGRGAA